MLSCLDARHCTVFLDCCYPSSPVLIALSIADISIERSSKLVSSGMVLSTLLSVYPLPRRDQSELPCPLHLVALGLV